MAVVGRALNGILATIGDTSLVELRRLQPELDARVYAKVERCHRSTTIKGRSAVDVLVGRIRAGGLVPDRSVVVDSGCDGVAVSLAQVCHYFGLRFVCVVDAGIGERHLAALREHHAEVEVVPRSEPDCGGFSAGRARRVRELMAATPDAFCPSQYTEALDDRAQGETMRELVETLDQPVDLILCPTAAATTLTNCARYVREHGLATAVVAVDPIDGLLFGPASARPGLGAGTDPAGPGLDQVIRVSDLECVVGCRRLARSEAILGGGLCGAVVAALGVLRPQIPAGSTCVLAFPDSGDRFLDTIFDDIWVNQHFGDVSHLWEAQTSH
jgi:cysteine synthase A